MDIRPVDLPELRAESLLWQSDNGDRMLRQWAGMAADIADAGELSASEIPQFSRYLWRSEITTLGRAELYFVARDMVTLSSAAAPGLPSFKVQAEDLPSRSGLMFFEGGFETGLTFEDDDSPWMKVRAVSWTCYSGVAAQGVQFSPYVDRSDLVASLATMDDGAEGGALAAANAAKGPRLVCMPQASFTAPFGDRGWQDLPESAAVTELLPMMLSAFLLMDQPLTRTTDVQPDRASRKRLRRDGQEPGSVRVIELRRSERASSEGDGSREYHHSWIVRGHWRQQWYPKREVHRPVWIAPHIKGPEDAPLIGGEKVYAWKR